jgi:membrane-associated protease RseP (regulator of RpoE activity)
VDDFHLIEQSISHYFPIIGFSDGDGGKEGSYFLVGDYNPHSFQELVQELDELGFVPFISPESTYYKINLAKKQEKGKSRIHINVILLLATIGTTLFAGYYLGEGDMWQAVAFAVALLGIIGAHELAHFFAARKHGVDATLPYFIPAPTIIGTFGALINIKSPIPNRRALFDLGYSGPLAGFIVAIPVLLIGLKLSTVPPILRSPWFSCPTHYAAVHLLCSSATGAGAPPASVALPDGWDPGNHVKPDASGFPDGGHISRSFFSQKIHSFVSIVGIMITVVLGWYLMAALMVVIYFINKGHPGALDNVAPMDRNRKIIAVVIVAVFILCLSPYPFTQ